MGFALRVRATGRRRIELPAADIQQAARGSARRDSPQSKTLVRYAALDLLGYRMGSLNEEL